MHSKSNVQGAYVSPYVSPYAEVVELSGAAMCAGGAYTGAQVTNPDGSTTTVPFDPNPQTDPGNGEDLG